MGETALLEAARRQRGASGGQEVLTGQGLRVALSGRTILRDVDFSLAAGEFCGLLGANGSGKTTLLRTILGFISPAQGRVTFTGESSRAIGYVPQRAVLDPFIPVRARDLVALGTDGHRLGFPLPSRARRQRVDEMLELVDATRFANQRVGRLSGGEQQRVLIAHALIRRPRLLLLDEPLASLDISSAAGIVALLRRIATNEQVAVFLSGHDMNPLLPAIDRVVYLANGRAASGRTEDVIRTDVLSELYGHHIDVIRVHGRIVVVAGDERADPVHVRYVP